MRQALVVLLLSAFACGQQAQTTDLNPQALQGYNAKWAQGVGPGYWPTLSSGLIVHLTAGTAWCNGSIVTYASGTLTMTNNTTNYIYLNTASSCVPAVKTTTFVSADIPISVVVSASGAITSITDDRTWFVPTNGCGTLTGDVTSIGCATTLTSIISASSCGDSTHSCSLTYDAKGRIIAATNNAITVGGGGSSGPSFGYQYCFTTEASGSNFISRNCASASSVTTGDFILFACSLFGNDGGTATLSASDSLGNTWNTAGTFYSSTSGGRLSVFWTSSGFSGADTFTCTSSVARGFWSLGAFNIIGASNTSPIDAISNNQGSGTTTISSAALTVTSSSDLAFMWCSTGGNDASANMQLGSPIQARSEIGTFLGVRTLGRSGTYILQVFNGNSTWSDISFALH